MTDATTAPRSSAADAVTTGTVHRVNVSDGGVPKFSVRAAEVTVVGLRGDRQNHRRFHGGPQRAVCLLGLDVIERLQAEGHPIAPGKTGENLTLAGVDWSTVTPGCRFRFEGGVELEVTSYARPCGTIRDAFSGRRFGRLDDRRHPGQARVYSRVLRTGTVREGERFELVPA